MDQILAKMKETPASGAEPKNPGENETSGLTGQLMAMEGGPEHIRLIIEMKNARAEKKAERDGDSDSSENGSKKD